ncbi:60S acidic ribosomal protein P1-alpha 3 [Blastocladiella emersonii ATCC 22665]|nr:60S acidic ribosomal protein P1-alpha 3 [Blastocladiella emersonii ATCC 22665]
MDESKSYFRVNAAMLSQFVGKTVVLPGRVESMNSPHQAILITADQGRVTVHLNQAIPPETAFMEVVGEAEADGTVRMQSYRSWPNTVDLDVLNDLIQLQFPHAQLFSS